ncbi:hypothetical protein AX14_010833 [Amanita brunnescens Koide BX004]|nr:hypothetical protein AX14_010833 [Amanita brunnescens Koide BX004]
MTENAIPNKVPDRYREFLRVERVWRHLATLRRSGQTHGIDRLLTYCRPNSLAVRCPACPEPGFNLENAEIQAASEDETHKYTLFLSADGNFRLQRKNKRGDPDDVALNNGNAYFVESEKCKEYLKRVKPLEDLGSCSHLQAVRMQNIVKFKNAVVTGEAFAITDYALSHALLEAENQRWIMLSYDIWCQYGRKIQKRFDESFPQQAKLLDRVRGAIPKMHVKNHIESCQQLYAFNYLKYSRETWGENIESSWAEQNQTAGSTKEQNDGHRHGSLDDYFGFWNWSKLRQLSSSLLKSYEKCLETLWKREAAFSALTSIHRPELVAQWECMDDVPKLVGGKVSSVFETRFKDAPPTQVQVYQTLVDAERISELSSEIRHNRFLGDAQLINLVIHIEDEQYRIRHLISMQKDQDPLLAARGKLQKKISDWKGNFFIRFPHFDYPKPLDPPLPEADGLLLPSMLNDHTRHALGLQDTERHFKKGPGIRRTGQTFACQYLRGTFTLNSRNSKYMGNGAIPGPNIY